MAKLVFTALLRRRGDGVQGESPSFPTSKYWVLALVFSCSIAGSALAKNALDQGRNYMPGRTYLACSRPYAIGRLKFGSPGSL